MKEDNNHYLKENDEDSVNELNSALINKNRLYYEEVKGNHIKLIERFDYISDTCLKSITLIPILLGFISVLITYDLIDINKTTYYPKINFGIIFLLLFTSIIYFLIGFTPKDKKLYHDPLRIEDFPSLTEENMLIEFSKLYNSYFTQNYEIERKISKNMDNGLLLSQLGIIFMFLTLFFLLIDFSCDLYMFFVSMVSFSVITVIVLKNRIVCISI